MITLQRLRQDIDTEITLWVQHFQKIKAPNGDVSKEGFGIVDTNSLNRFFCVIPIMGAAMIASLLILVVGRFL